MQYLGGKARSAKYIVPIIQSHISGGVAFVEPFCGACNITASVRADRRLAGDANAALIAMWQAVQQGWDPPSSITQQQYEHIRALDPMHVPAHLRAFVALGCSWGGKWWGGYARGTEGRSYASNARNSINRKRAGIRGVLFSAGAYTQYTDVRGAVLYLDPPYEGTTGYTAVGAFDSASFWAWAEHMARHNIVLVSEYSNPRKHEVLWAKGMREDMRTVTGGTRNELLMRVEPRETSK